MYTQLNNCEYLFKYSSITIKSNIVMIQNKFKDSFKTIPR